MSSPKEKQQQILQPLSDPTKKNDSVNSPNHYIFGKIEVIDFIESQGLDDFRLANCIKYVARCQYKGSEKEDIQKAIWYLNRYLKFKFGE